VPYQIFSKDKSLNLVFERAAEAAARPTEVPVARVEPPAVRPAPVQQPAPAPAPQAAAPAAAPPAAPVVTAAAAAPQPAPPAGPRAQRILNVTQGTEMGQLAFTIKADGTLRYQDFFLGNPDRLVVDFVDVTSRAPIRNMEVNEGPVRKVRL